jgi:hypothetical protein
LREVNSSPANASLRSSTNQGCLVVDILDSYSEKREPERAIFRLDRKTSCQIGVWDDAIYA